MAGQSDEELEKDWLKDLPVRIDKVFNKDKKITRDEWKKKKAYILSGDENTKRPGFSFLVHIFPYPAIWGVLLTLAGGVAWGLFTIFQMLYEMINHGEKGSFSYRVFEYYLNVFKPLVSSNNPGALLILVALASAMFGLIFLLLWWEKHAGERFKDVKDKEGQSVDWRWWQTVFLFFWIIIALIAAVTYVVFFVTLATNFLNDQESKDTFVVITISFVTFLISLVPFVVLYLSVLHVWALLPYAKTLRKKRVFVWGFSILSIVLFYTVKSFEFFVAKDIDKRPDFWFVLSFVIAGVIFFMQVAWYLFGIGDVYSEWKSDEKKSIKSNNRENYASASETGSKKTNEQKGKMPIINSEKRSAYEWFKSEVLRRAGALIIVLILLFVALPIAMLGGLIPSAQEVFEVFT